MFSETDVVWTRRYVRPVEMIRNVPHAAAFLVYHYGKVVERHFVSVL